MSAESGVQAKAKAYGFLALALLLLLCPFAYYHDPVWVGVYSLFMILVVLAAVGCRVAGRYDGILIESLYRMSLSRFQVTAWTVVGLSAWLSIGVVRIANGHAEPLHIRANGSQAKENPLAVRSVCSFI